MITIAITGAGPVGLTLARLLLTSPIASSVQITIFEKDTSPKSRRSLGGTIDLHPETGLAAMRKMNLWDEFEKYARFDGEEMRMGDQNGYVYFHQKDAPQMKGFDARPEIDRVRLLEVLLGGVPEDLLRWGKQLKEVVEEDGKWKLRFEDGSVEGPFDLLIGADGAWSKVRNALTNVQPSYSGICGFAGTIDQDSAGERWESISAMVGKGNNFNFSYGRSMTGQRMGDGTVKCGFYQKREMKFIEDLRAQYGNDDEALRRVMLAEYKEWVPELQQWIIACKDIWVAGLYELPTGHRFEHKSGISIIGDAAHLMTPFAGEGVNAGMRDALDLAAAIEKALSSKEDLDHAVKKFEELMFARAADFMEGTMINKNGMFAQDAPYSFFSGMVGVIAKEVGWDLRSGFMRWLPISKAAYSVFWTMGSFGALRRRATDLFRQRPAGTV